MAPEIDIGLDAESCRDTPLWLFMVFFRLNITNNMSLLAQEPNLLKNSLSSWDYRYDSAI